jgi:hypothetical protein
MECAARSGGDPPGIRSTTNTATPCPARNAADASRPARHPRQNDDPPTEVEMRRVCEEVGPVADQGTPHTRRSAPDECAPNRVPEHSMREDLLVSSDIHVVCHDQGGPRWRWYVGWICTDDRSPSTLSRWSRARSGGAGPGSRTALDRPCRQRLWARPPGRSIDVDSELSCLYLSFPLDTETCSSGRCSLMSRWSRPTGRPAVIRCGSCGRTASSH